jgi:Trk K+ transport system NAD-binding subunit
MQDIIVVIVLSILSTSTAGFDMNIIADAILKAVGLFSLALVVSRYIAPKILHLVSRSTELVFLTALSFAFMFALSSHILGFSTAIGGFLGGISLAVFPYNLEVTNRIKPLRDFFAIMFFVSLGMQFTPLSDFSVLVLPVIVFSVLVLVAKPLIITFLSILTGYERRTAFLSGIGLGQISEFSLILVMGWLVIAGNGLVATTIFSLTLILAIVTISVTPYLIRYGYTVYIPFSGLLARLERFRLLKSKHQLEHVPTKNLKDHVIVFGAHIMGMEVIEKLIQMKKKFIVVDHNPEIIKKLIKRHVHCVYGDLEDAEVLEKVNIKDCKAVISTVPDEDDSLFLIEKMNEKNPDAMVFVTAKTIGHAIKFYREGADFIIHLKLLGGQEASDRLEAALKKGPKSALKMKLKEIEFLEKKKREEIIDHVDAQFVKQIDELKAKEKIDKSATLGEE